MNKPAQTDPTQTVSVSVAASMLHVSEKTIRRRIKAGELEARKVSLDGGGIGWRVQIGGAMETEPDNGLDNVPEPRRQRDGQRAGTSHAQTATALDNALDTMDTRAGTELDTRRNRIGHAPEP